jgi:hypothetical protein
MAMMGKAVERDSGLMVLPGREHAQQCDLIIALAARHCLPDGIFYCSRNTLVVSEIFRCRVGATWGMPHAQSGTVPFRPTGLGQATCHPG